MKTRLTDRKGNYAASVKINMPDHFSPASPTTDERGYLCHNLTVEERVWAIKTTAMAQENA